MRRISRHRPSPAMAVALIALLVALGGVAFASIPGPRGVVKSCYSKSNGSLRVIDSKKSCSSKHEQTLSWNQQGPQGLRGFQGIQGPQGPQGNSGQNGTNGTNGTPGSARAYGTVAGGGVISNSKGVIGNATGPTGIYCINLDPSIDATKAQVIATPNIDADSTIPDVNGDLSHVEWAAGRGHCSGNRIEVNTFHYAQTSTTQDTLSVANEGFAFMVP